MRERLIKTIKKYAVLLVIGTAYLIWVFCTDIKIPCVFHLLTGYDCPACGVTRMLTSIAKFRFAEAYAYNPFLFLHLPIILFCLGYSDVRYIKTGNRTLGKLSIVLWIEIALLLLFGILRNFIGI